MANSLFMNPFPELGLQTDLFPISDPAMNGSLKKHPTMKSYAQVISLTIALDSLTPKHKGDYVAITVNLKAYEEYLKLCSYSLIGRVFGLKAMNHGSSSLLKTSFNLSRNLLCNGVSYLLDVVSVKFY